MPRSVELGASVNASIAAALTRDPDGLWSQYREGEAQSEDRDHLGPVLQNRHEHVRLD